MEIKDMWRPLLRVSHVRPGLKKAFASHVRFGVKKAVVSHVRPGVKKAVRKLMEIKGNYKAYQRRKLKEIKGN